LYRASAAWSAAAPLQYPARGHRLLRQPGLCSLQRRLGLRDSRLGLVGGIRSQKYLVLADLIADVRVDLSDCSARGEAQCHAFDRDDARFGDDLVAGLDRREFLPRILGRLTRRAQTAGHDVPTARTTASTAAPITILLISGSPAPIPTPYASTSRTVNRDAFQAGRKLAMAANTITIPNQSPTPTSENR
jgi:hypothetical protein